jgi:hypothetical protein
MKGLVTLRGDDPFDDKRRAVPDGRSVRAPATFHLADGKDAAEILWLHCLSGLEASAYLVAIWRERFRDNVLGVGA